MTSDKSPVSAKGHLKELRERLLRSIAVLGLSAIVSFYFSDTLLSWLRKPLAAPCCGLPNHLLSPPELVFISPAEVFLTDIKISLFFGLAAALPFLLYQLWRFIAPGLVEKERRSVYPFLLFSSLSFYAGIAFSYFLALPFATQFLMAYGQQKGILPRISIAAYIDFNLIFLFSFGMIFEVPMVMVLLSKTGLLTVPFLTHYRKYAVVLAFIIAAILTPTPDIFNQALMAIPLMILYEIGIVAVRFFGSSVPQTKATEARLPS
jgi:sec-independent protein translocase protein TatC